MVDRDTMHDTEAPSIEPRLEVFIKLCSPAISGFPRLEAPRPYGQPWYRARTPGDRRDSHFRRGLLARYRIGLHINAASLVRAFLGLGWVPQVGMLNRSGSFGHSATVQGRDGASPPGTGVLGGSWCSTTIRSVDHRVATYCGNSLDRRQPGSGR